jgi:hypothetical protein
MLVYNYDRITKEYTYSQEAELDREESRIKGIDIYLVPAYATLQQPLSSKQGYAVIFDSIWIYTPDHRGQKVINPETEEIVVVDYLGELKDGYVDYEIYINSEEYKEKKAKEEKERLMMSNMTKLDFVNALEPFGVNYYEHIVPLLNSNLEAKKQWDLCERVYRFNPLLDELAKGFGITPNQLDKIFGGQ